MAKDEVVVDRAMIAAVQRSTRSIASSAGLVANGRDVDEGGPEVGGRTGPP